MGKGENKSGRAKTSLKKGKYSPSKKRRWDPEAANKLLKCRGMKGLIRTGGEGEESC